MMIDLNVTPERSMNASNSAQNMGLEGSMEDEMESHQRATAIENPIVEALFLDHVLSDEEINSVVMSDAEAAEMNYFTGSLIAITQPTISERYDCPTHFSSLNLDAINEQVSHSQRAPDDDPTSEFEVGQEFHNKEFVLMAVKTYCINRAVTIRLFAVEVAEIAITPLGNSLLNRLLPMKLEDLKTFSLDRHLLP
ncbi:hypothetical protein PIB30_048695 [Stylosanthes scabra]|uniref:Uncharacterized protein n=1 Tax=Stylosanthes scabra TaxID=79078 RepID=A0ABU6SIM1_9FABA|nr:hypothetical protein [Stylosanthes scabra]